MPLLTLPNELLHQIAHCLLRCPTCQCNHISQHLSALSRSNQLLHALLAESVLASASTLHMLLWEISNSRHDTLSLALEHGADPNTPLRPNRHINTSRCISTPMDVALQMRAQSLDAKSHALKLGTVALLLVAGGTCTVDGLTMITHYGDLDLLALCLPHLVDIGTESHRGPQTLLGIAARRGHVEVARMVIGAGAAVNSSGPEASPEFYPPLRVLWDASLAVLKVLLDAGADPTWCDGNGVSIVRYMRERSIDGAELDSRVALMVLYGAVDEPALWHALVSPPRQERHPLEREYRGWAPGRIEAPVDWAQEWVLAGRAERCGCPSC